MMISWVVVGENDVVVCLVNIDLNNDDEEAE